MVDRVLPLEQLRDAHEVLEASTHVGKVALTIAG